MNAEPTRKETETDLNGQTAKDPDMQDEYDFKGGIRGKYIQRLAGSIHRDMVPEHAKETWDIESAKYGELFSPAKTRLEAETD